MEGGGGEVELIVRIESNGTLVAEVADTGVFIDRERLPNRGFGLEIMCSLAQTTELVRADGTRIRMVFDIQR